MANTFTNPTWVKAKPHASAEKQVGDSDPSARADVVNRVEKGLAAVIKRIINALFDGIGVDLSDQSTTSALTGGIFGQMFGGVLFGLTLSNNGADATNDIDIAVGEAVSGDAAIADRVLMSLTSAMTKKSDAAWAVGTNAGWLDTGTIGNGTYFVWLIKRTDTAVVDSLLSLSASSPTMPTNYTKKRLIGMIIREADAIVAFVQVGDRVERAVPVAAYDSGANPGTAALTATLTGVPNGVSVEAIIGWYVISQSGGEVYALLTALDTTDTAPSTTLFNAGGQSSDALVGQLTVRTNASGQIRVRLSSSGAATRVKLTIIGWIYTRKREA